MKKGTCIAVAFALLAGCGQETAPRYQVVVSADGKHAYRINTETGDMWYLRGTTSFRVMSPEETEKMAEENASAAGESRTTLDDLLERR